MRSTFVLKLTRLLLSAATLSRGAHAAVYADPDDVVYGKGAARCEDDLPTLSFAKENLINTKAEWDEFTKKHPFFVVGAADSQCSNCCDSEPLLRDLSLAVMDKAQFSFPEKHKKQKKIIRKEITIARIDLANKELTHKLGEWGVWFPMGTTVQIVQSGKVTKYDGQFRDVNMLLHHMQRYANPVINLTSEEQIKSFLEVRPAKIWDEDYSGVLCAKGKSFDEERKMDTMLQKAGFNTRVVAFYYDKEEYAEEIKMLRESAKYMSNRYNLRIGMVTDQRLVTKMRKAHAELFLEAGMSVMVLKRYDGTLFKLNVADTQPVRYVWWITVKSVKPIDKMSGAGYQITESARMPIITVFVDFSEPVVAEKSTNLIKALEGLALEFQERMMFYWTDEEIYMQQRRVLGITWDELPSMGLNSVEHVIYAYPQHETFDKENLRRWLQTVSLRKTEETELRTTDFAKRQRDPTMVEFFLDKTIQADRKIFDEVILREDADSIVFVYSSENVNYVQRKACFQYSLVVDTLSNEAQYGDMVGRLLKFYSYDAYQHGFPKGVPFGNSPPQDTRGTMVLSDEQRRAGVPAVYIFPAGKKSLPYTKLMKFPYADDVVEFIAEKAGNYLKLKPADLRGLGRNTADEVAFQKLIDKEGIIELAVEYDEL